MSGELEIDFRKHFASEINSLGDLEGDGLVQRSACGLAVTALGCLFIRNIAVPGQRAREATMSRCNGGRPVSSAGPQHVTLENWEALPATITVSYVRYRINISGFRTRHILVATTLLEVPAKASGRTRCVSFKGAVDATLRFAAEMAQCICKAWRSLRQKLFRPIATDSQPNVPNVPNASNPNSSNDDQNLFR